MGSDEEYQLLSGMAPNPTPTTRRAHAQRSPGDERLLPYRGRGASVCRPAKPGGGENEWRARIKF